MQDDFISYWENLAIRSTTLNVNSDFTTYMDGAFEMIIYNLGKSTFEIKINDGEPFTFQFSPNGFGFANPFKLEGKPYIRRFDKIDFKFIAGGKPLLFITKNFIVPITIEDKKTIYEAKQG